jgi:hypothetical protein
VELKDVLGATGEASAQRFSLYLPEKDRDGAPVPRHDEWVEAAMTIFADVNGGATRLPTAQGIWKPETGAVVREATSVVYSFIRDTGTFEAGLERLARFIHTFGKHAKQGELMVEFAGEVPAGGEGELRFVSRAYFIDEYPKAGAKPF